MDLKKYLAISFILNIVSMFFPTLASVKNWPKSTIGLFGYQQARIQTFNQISKLNSKKYLFEKFI
jgi:hypothetical protein